MNIFGTFCFLLSGAFCITLGVAVLRWACARLTSITVNQVDTSTYPPEIWLSSKERQQLGLIRHLIQTGKISEDLPDGQVCE